MPQKNTKKHVRKQVPNEPIYNPDSADTLRKLSQMMENHRLELLESIDVILGKSIFIALENNDYRNLQEIQIIIEGHLHDITECKKTIASGLVDTDVQLHPELKKIVEDKLTTKVSNTPLFKSRNN